MFRDAGYLTSLDFLSWKSHLKLVREGRFDVSVGVWESPQFDGCFSHLENLTLDLGAFVVLTNSNLKDGRLVSFSNEHVGLNDGGGYPDELIRTENIRRVNLSNLL